MKFTPAEIVAAVEAEEVQAGGAQNSQLEAERSDALDRYLGRPYGNEQEGRSQVVDRSIADTVEWIMPSLARVYMGGDEIGRFEARGPEDEDAAEIETDVCNWYLQRSDFFSQVSAILRDALLLKNGYAVVYWTKRYDTMTETYQGMADEEAAMLMEDKEVEIVEHTQYPDIESVGVATGASGMASQSEGMGVTAPGQAQAGGMPAMLHDIKVERKKCDEYPAVESVPPDEIRVSRRHRWTSLADADFVQWRRRISIGQLRAEGFEIDDDTPADDEMEQQRVSRERYGDTILDEDSPDPTRRMVLMKHTWMRADFRGTGTPQLWRIDLIEGADKPTRTEEADVVQIAAFSPVIYPHSHIGTSVYDLIADLALVKTTLIRQYLDGVYLANNGRTAVDINRASLDDVLINRPGGVIRGDGNPNEWMMPVVSPDVTGTVLQGLQYIDATKEQRTGVRAWTEGLGQSSLHPTATGVASVDSAAAQRIELIARTLAGGFRDLFCIIHAIASKHSTKPIQIKLNNEWKSIDPRSWVRRTDFSISVGLGVGTPDAQLAKLNALAPMLGQAMQMGLAGPQEAYNYGAEVLKAAGYRNPERFIHPPATDPQTGQPMLPPPKDDPMVATAKVKAQADQQKSQMEMANDAQKFQAEQQAKTQQITLQDQMKQRELAANLELQRSNDERAAQLELQKHTDNMQLQREKILLEAQTQLEVARISRGLDEGLSEASNTAKSTSESIVSVGEQFLQTLQQSLAGMQEAMQSHAQAMQQYAAMATAPKRIVRDPATGKAVGVEVVRH